MHTISVAQSLYTRNKRRGQNWGSYQRRRKLKNLCTRLDSICWNCAAFHHLCRFAITRQPHSTLHTLLQLLQVSGYVHKPTVMEESTISMGRLSLSRHIQTPAGESIRVTNISFDILMLVHLLSSQCFFFVRSPLILDVLQQFSI